MDTKAVAGYFRVSKARDGMKAPDLYTQEIERYCAYKGLELEKIFSDIDCSAFRGARPRPELEALIDARLRFAAVIVPKLARFGRSMKELVELFDLFDADGISLVFLDMNIDTNTSQGRLLRHVMAAFAEYESDVKSDYARANHRHVRSLGRPWGGRPPFGYDHHPTERSYAINHERAAIIRRVFARYLAGASQYEIARELNAGDMLRPSGKPWSCQQVGRVLDNPAYAALCIVDDELIAAVWEPIVGRSEWDQVRRARAHDKRRFRQLRTVKPGPYLLSGLLCCGHCGRKLHHRSRPGSANGIYVCVRPGGKRCPGGSIDCARADTFVAGRFLDRCQFTLEGAQQGTFSDGERRWEGASMLERRSVLSLAVRRVVLVAWPGGESPQRTPGRRRELRIEWAKGIRDTTPLALVASSVPSPPPRRQVSEGRSEMMREVEVQEFRKHRRARSERASAYYEEWARFRQGEWARFRQGHTRQDSSEV